MLQSVVLGAGFGFAAVIQPGPLQAFLLSRAASHGWKRTLPAALSPVLSDGPIAVIVLVVLGQLPATAQQLLRAAGGVLLLYLAWTAARNAGSVAAAPPPGTAPRTLLQATTVNLLNPNPYLGWALVLGPAAATAWHRHPAEAVALVAAFYGVMVVGLGAFIVLASSARLLPARTLRGLVLLSAVILALLGVYQLIAAIRSLASI